ncbi:MAG TPA: glutamate--tRNA ligase family protein, partial [Candidatus Paceibacterota bacterium]|nr:glutamate--tRNA ligase family protein [Candidatus Paceibacterota bacterium]
EEILEGLAWLGLAHDEFVRQSERAERHRELLEQLVGKDIAYISKEESKLAPGSTAEVVRLRNQSRDITFRDEVRGDITFHTGELGDFVIARAIDDPLYHFAVVTDDWDMAVTHVIRGEDHISNTSRQILIQEALGAPRPFYAHLPLILGSDRSKLSKRNGATSLMEYRTEGFLPEGIVNYLALLGWSPGTDEEHFSLAGLAERFDLSGVQKSPAVWDRDKLLSVNQRWMRALTDDDFIARGNFDASLDTKMLRKAVPLLKERAQTMGEAREMLEGELAGLFQTPELSREILLAKEPEDRPGLTKAALEGLLAALEALPEGVSAEAVKEALMPLADAEEAKGKGGRGGTLWPLRYALSGKERSPDPFTLVVLLGLHEAISRVRAALDIL